MASASAYATSLRHDRGREDKPAVESGVPFFVPHLAKVKTNVMCQAKKSQHLLFSFEKDDAAMGGGGGGGGASGGSPTAIPYRKQGDKELDSDDNMRRRRKLLHDRQVLGAIARFWETFPVVRQGAAQIEQPDYVDVFVKLYKALVAPSEFSVAEAKRIVEKDWVKDVGSDSSVAMSKDLFNRALFEVADIWTVGIGGDEYASFLTKLFKRVTMTVYDHERSRWVTVFQELDRIRSFAAVDPQEDAGKEFASLVATAVASSASKPPRAPLVKRKSLKSDDPATDSAVDAHAAASGQRSPSTLADARQPRRRQDSILPLSLSPDSANASSTPTAQQHPLSSARSPFGRCDQSRDDGVDGKDDSSRAGASETLLATTSDAPLRTARRHQLGPRAQDRGDDFRSDDNDDNDDEASDGGDSDPDGNNGDSQAPIARTQSSKSMAGRRLQRSASTKSEASTSASQSRRKLGGLLSKGPTPTSPTRPVLPELPTQHIHLTMPNIYLSPDLTQSQATERAARRRVRKSAKLAQRLRRITF